MISKTANNAYRSLIGWATLALYVTACDVPKPNTGQEVAANPSSTISTQLTDNWLGKWSGPEGTFIQIDGGNGQYELIIQNLDGPRTFTAYAMDNLIAFERDGVKENLRATNGIETGMKWLNEKTNCLTIRAGEGYCRN